MNGSLHKVDFISCYRNLPQVFTDEVQEYFKLPGKYFHTCNPLQWWAAWRSQFPNLTHFARDIISIPGDFITDCNCFSYFSLSHCILCRICCFCRAYFFRRPLSWYEHGSLLFEENWGCFSTKSLYSEYSLSIKAPWHVTLKMTTFNL